MRCTGKTSALPVAKAMLQTQQSRSISKGAAAAAAAAAAAVAPSAPSSSSSKGTISKNSLPGSGSQPKSSKFGNQLFDDDDFDGSEESEDEAPLTRNQIQERLKHAERGA
jgi:hypothetical protein